MAWIYIGVGTHIGRMDLGLRSTLYSRKYPIYMDFFIHSEILCGVGIYIYDLGRKTALPLCTKAASE